MIQRDREIEIGRYTRENDLQRRIDKEVDKDIKRQNELPEKKTRETEK